MTRAVLLVLVTVAGCSSLDGLCSSSLDGRPVSGTCLSISIPFPILDTLERWF